MHNPARSPLSYRTRHELVEQMVPRYKEASLAQKTLLLDAFVAVTGNARNYAIRLLSHATEVKHTLRRPRTPHYGPEVQQVLFLAWTTANQICAKRPIPFLTYSGVLSEKLVLVASPPRERAPCSKIRSRQERFLTRGVSPIRQQGDILRELQRLSLGRYHPLHIRTLLRGMRKIRAYPARKPLKSSGKKK